MTNLIEIKMRKLPSLEEIERKLPLPETERKKIEKDREEIRNILEGKSKKLLVIVGPCSAWPNEAVLEYATRLRALEEALKDKLKIIMRVYTQKPRTTKGWTGCFLQPDPLKEADIEKGMYYARDMMLKVLKIGLPIADEVLFTHNTRSLQELLSWAAIGARSAEDQEHRILASLLDCAVGMKNPTSGSIEIGVNGVVSAQSSHTLALDGWEVQTKGNDHAHLILRGGERGPNYSEENIKKALVAMRKHNIKNPAVIIDASHDNIMIDGVKNYRHQIKVIEKVLDVLKINREIADVIKGVMLESFIKGGNQKINKDKPEDLDMGGLSITDACLSWEETEKLLKEIHSSL